MEELNNKENIGKVKYNTSFLQKVLSFGMALMIPISGAQARYGPRREFDNKYFEIYRQLLYKAIERDNEKNKQELEFKGFNLVASTLPYKMDEIIELHDDKFDLDAVFKVGLIKSIKDIDSDKELSYDELLDYARKNGTRALALNTIIIYGENCNWDNAILYYDYNADKVMVLPVRLNIENKVKDYSDQYIPFDLEKGMAYWRNPLYQPVAAIKREILDSSEIPYLDESKKIYLTFEEIMEIYRNKGYVGLKDIVLIVEGATYNLIDVIVRITGDRIYVQIPPFDYKKLYTQMESGEYFNAKDAFERRKYGFTAYSLENGEWKGMINHHGLQDLYEKYGDDVVNEVQLFNIIETGTDEDGWPIVEETPFEITGIKETEEGLMISIEKSDPVKLAEKYAKKGLSFEIINAVRAGIITVAHKKEGFLTAEELEQMYNEALQHWYTERNYEYVFQLIENLVVFDGNAEKLIAGQVYDSEDILIFAPDAPIVTENVSKGYQKVIGD